MLAALGGVWVAWGPLKRRLRNCSTASAQDSACTPASTEDTKGESTSTNGQLGSDDPQPLAAVPTALRDAARAEELFAALFTLIGPSSQGTIRQHQAQELLGGLAEQCSGCFEQAEAGSCDYARCLDSILKFLLPDWVNLKGANRALRNALAVGQIAASQSSGRLSQLPPDLFPSVALSDRTKQNMQRLLEFQNDNFDSVFDALDLTILKTTKSIGET